MPRIRKETSNRKSTNDRAKRRKQVKESKRKKSKAAKKSVQWKSKTPKDPGIPNEFPYKDQILAEVAEQRRIAAEEKERKKAQKQRALAKTRAIARGEPIDDSDVEEDMAEDGIDEDEGSEKGKKDLNVGADNIAGLSAKVVGTHLKPRPRPIAEAEEEEAEEEEVPVLINRDLPNLKTVLEKADVLLEVLDGRDPLAFRSKYIEELGSKLGKKVLLVVNKIDTCPQEVVASWSSYLRSQHPTLLFRSATSFLPESSMIQSLPQAKKGKAKAKIPTDDAVGRDSVLACLAQWAKEKKGSEPLAVAVVGVTNVGKSSLINSLLKRSTLPVYTLASSSRGPTTTELPQEVTLELEDQKILFIDTPGLSFISKGEDDSEEAGSVDGTVLEECRARDILLRSKGRIDRLKDPHPPVAHIVSRANTENLMLMYSLPAFSKGDSTAFLSGVARANQLLKKKGELDLTGAARIVLRDWSSGKFSHYTTPPLPKPTSATPISAPESTPTSSVNATLEQLYKKDISILVDIPTRKERRKRGGLVRLMAGVTDQRPVSIEETWAALQDSEEEESEAGNDVEDVNAGMPVDQEDPSEDEDEEDEEDEERQPDSDEEEEEEEEETQPRLSNKQKRKRTLDKSIPERPTKKVAFAPQPPPKNSRSGSKRSGDAVVRPSPSLTAKQVLRVLAAQQVKSPQKPVHSVATQLEKSKSSISGSKPAKSRTSVGSAGDALAKPPLENNGKVANRSTNVKNKAASGDQKPRNEPEVYDFGQFF